MAAKVDAIVLARILTLKRQSLTHEIIAQRLGLSLRTVRFYISQLRAAGQIPSCTTPR